MSEHVEFANRSAKNRDEARKFIMIKKMACLLIIWIFWGNCVNAQTVMLGYVDFPPYEFEEDGHPAGILVTIVETLFKRAEIPLSLNLFPFERAYNYVKEGKVNGLFNFYKTEKRLEFFDYTNPVIQNSLVFFVRKDSEIQFNTLEDLRGLTIGAIRGYTYGQEFDTSTLFKKEMVTNHIQNFKKLLTERIDAYPCDILVGVDVATKNQFMADLDVLPTPLRLMEGHIGFTKGQHREIITKINDALRIMHQNGEIEKIIRQYLEKMEYNINMSYLK